MFLWILAAGCLQHLSWSAEREEGSSRTPRKKAGKEKQGEEIMKRAEGEAEKNKKKQDKSHEMKD